MIKFLFISLLTLMATSAFAQGLGQQDRYDDELTVVADAAQGSLTGVSVPEAREQLEQIPGSIGFVEADVFLDNFAQSIGDALVLTPGVFADTSAQREARLSIRGSGLNASFERRGLTVLRDGVPISRASGITEFQEVDPLSIRYIEVFKGANGLRYGAASLGGAINLVTPTGHTAEHDVSARFEAGSFNTHRANIAVAHLNDKTDFYLTGTTLVSDGFRDHSAVDSQYIFANFGITVSETIETRFYLTTLVDRFELAGALTLDQARNTPRLSAQPVFGGPRLLDAGAIADDWDRNLRVDRIANKTVVDFDQWQLETSVWFATRDLDHAITRFAGIIDQDEDEWGSSLRVSNEASRTGAFGWTVGAQYSRSDNDARRWQNNFGIEGELRSRSHQDADNLILYGETRWYLLDNLALVGGLQAIEVTRENQALFNDISGEIDYDGVNGRFGLLWTPRPGIQWFVNLNEGYEPPGISDLTSGGALDFTPLKAQESLTYELGGRGQIALSNTLDFAWDIAAYYSEIENEFIDLNVQQGPRVISVTDNSVSETVHQGVELGFDLVLQAFDNSRVSWRNALAVNDFQFDDHPVYNNNTLAGVPDQIYISTLRYDWQQRWYVGINARVIPDGAFVDYANTLQLDGYELYGFNAGVRLSEQIKIYVVGENITDEQYISNTSTLANARIDSNTTFATPGQGDAFYLGAELTF